MKHWIAAGLLGVTILTSAGESYAREVNRQEALRYILRLTGQHFVLGSPGKFFARCVATYPAALAAAKDVTGFASALKDGSPQGRITGDNSRRLNAKADTYNGKVGPECKITLPVN